MRSGFTVTLKFTIVWRSRESCFADLNDDINLAEDMLKYIIKDVLENAPEEMEFFDKSQEVTVNISPAPSASLEVIIGV